MHQTLGVSPTFRTRRGLLTTVSGAVGALLAGCVRSDTTGTGEDDDTERDEPTDSGDEADSSTDDGRDSSADDGKPLEGGDPPTSAPPGDPPDDCPEYDVATTRCYGTIDETDTYLEPAGPSVTHGGSLQFTLRNGSERVLETNFYNWALHRYVDGAWFYVAPREWPEPLMHLPPGDSHTWTVSVDNEAALAGEPVPGVTGTEELPLQGLGGGHYAFRARGWFESGNYQDDIAFAATFELDADPIPLVPTDAIESIEREHGTVVAETSRGDPDEHSRAAYTLERIDGDTDRTMIVEQVYRDDQLRDALALAYEHGLDRVRLEEYTGSIPPFAMSFEGRFEFQGERFEVTTEEI